jgi:hypothetical protein
MPAWLIELGKLAPALLMPIAYAALTYGFFHWLDKKASGSAKKALAEWMKPKEFDRMAISSMLVEVFDRIYAAPLPSVRSFIRSAVITAALTAVLLYEIYAEAYHAIPGNIVARNVPSLVISSATLATNILSDYISLFVVRLLLLLGQNRPIVSSIVGPLAGAAIVLVAMTARDIFIRVGVFGQQLSFLEDLYSDMLYNFTWSYWGAGAGRDVVGISRGAVSEQLMVSDQAARSIG